MVAVRLACAALLPAALACSPSSKPVDVRPGDTCAHCRMAVSEARVAGQIAAPNEEPVFFDDIGCLASAVTGGRMLDLPYAYVADHQTGAWVPATKALYTHAPSLATPMGSHVIAHADDSSRRADNAAAGGTVLTFQQVLDRTKGGDRE